MNTSSEPRAKKIAAFVIALLVAPILLLVGIELASRAAINLIYGVSGKTYGIFRPDPVIGHFPAPNSYNHITTLNNAGFRNTEDVIDPRREGAVRVVTYGGSTTFCPKITIDACWSHQLEKHLRDGDTNTSHQVLNGGVVLWSLSHILERAKRDLPVLQPDAVILYSGFNESANATFLKLGGTPIRKFLAEGRRAVAARNYPASEWLSFHSILFKIARGFVASGYKHFLPPAEPMAKPSTEATALPSTNITALPSTDAMALPSTDPAILENYLAALERLVKVIRDSGAEPIFVIQASTEAAASAYSQIGARMACKLGVRTLDARQSVAAYQGSKDELFRSSIHYSVKGNAIFGKYLFDHLYGREGYSICSNDSALLRGSTG